MRNGSMRESMQVTTASPRRGLPGQTRVVKLFAIAAVGLDEVVEHRACFY